MMTISETQFIACMQDAATMGAQIALAGAGIGKRYLSRREANKLYGEAVVDKWIEQGLISSNKKGNGTSRCYFDYAECEALIKAKDRWKYIAQTEDISASDTK